MFTEIEDDFISVKTNYEGDFVITISLKNGNVIFSETMQSYSKEIRLEGFSLNKHTVTISPTQ